MNKYEKTSHVSQCPKCIHVLYCLVIEFTNYSLHQWLLSCQKLKVVQISSSNWSRFYAFGLCMVCVSFRLPRFFLLNRGEHHYRPIDEGVYVLLFLIIKSPSRYRNEYWHTRAKYCFSSCTWLSQVMHYFTLESAYFFTFSKGLKEYIYQDFLPWNLFDIYS